MQGNSRPWHLVVHPHSFTRMLPFKNSGDRVQDNLSWFRIQKNRKNYKMIAMRRISQELNDITENPPPSCTVGPGADMYSWKATIKGAEDSPFAGGVFAFDIHFPTDYPLKPPKVVIVTKIYHPNANNSGDISLDILKEKWSSVLSISQVLHRIHSLFTEPNLENALNSEIAQMYKEDRNKYEATARSWTHEYALQPAFTTPQHIS